jgi:hypothetical protein
MKDNQEVKNLLPKDLLEEVEKDCEDKLSNTFSDENNKIFDEPSSNDEGTAINDLETVSYINISKMHILI